MKKSFLFIVFSLSFCDVALASDEGGAEKIWEVVEKCDAPSLRAFLSRFPGAACMRHLKGNGTVDERIYEASWMNDNYDPYNITPGDTPLHFVTRHCKIQAW